MAKQGRWENHRLRNSDCKIQWEGRVAMKEELLGKNSIDGSTHPE